MPISLDHARDLVRFGLLGTVLFRLFGKARKRQERAFPAGGNAWHEGNDETAIGFEASWAGIFPRPGK